jgi:hypothetical protein
LPAILEASSARIKPGLFPVSARNVAAAKSGTPRTWASVRKCTKKPLELQGSGGTMGEKTGSTNGWDNHPLKGHLMTNQNNQSGKNDQQKHQNQPQSGQQAGQQQRQPGQQGQDNQKSGQQGSGQQGSNNQNKQR